MRNKWSGQLTKERDNGKPRQKGKIFQKYRKEFRIASALPAFYRHQPQKYGSASSIRIKPGPQLKENSKYVADPAVAIPAYACFI